MWWWFVMGMNTLMCMTRLKQNFDYKIVGHFDETAMQRVLSTAYGVVVNVFD